MDRVTKHINETIQLLTAYIQQDKAQIFEALPKDVLEIRTRIDTNRLVIMYLQQIQSMMPKDRP